MHFPYGDGIVGWVALHLSPANVPEARWDPRFDRTVDAIYCPDDENAGGGEGGGSESHDGLGRNLGVAGRGAMLAVPAINMDGSLLGVLAVMDKRDGGAFTASDVSLLRLQVR
jgi:hypothetical protein